MNDPWQVLGVSRDASDEQIKAAYRKLAHKYHPDLNPGDAAAAKKMQEINAAYDQIKNPDSYRAAQAQEQARQNAQSGGYGYARQEDPFGGGWNPFSGWGYTGWGNQQQQQNPRQSAENSARTQSAKNFLNARQYDQAIQVLNSIPIDQRNAEWYYLSASANYQVGNRITAQHHAQTAVQMEPNNPLYRELLNRMQQGANSYQQRVVHIPNIGKTIAGICIMDMLCQCLRCCRI